MLEHTVQATVSGSVSEFPTVLQRTLLPHQVHIWQLASLRWLQSLARITVPVSEHPTSQRNIPSASLFLNGANPALWNKGQSKRMENPYSWLELQGCSVSERGFMEHQLWVQCSCWVVWGRQEEKKVS